MAAGLAWSDLKSSVRGLCSRPAFTLVTVLVLALGTGAAGLMFGTLNTIVLRPLPFAEPDRLVWLWGTSEASRRNTVSALDYFDYRVQFKAFDSLAACFTFRPTRLLTGGPEPERVTYTLVSHNLFSTLGVGPRLGRMFRLDEERAGAPNVVIVSHGFWQRRLGGERGAIGETLTLDGEKWEIVGVMPAGFAFPEGVELWSPMRHNELATSGRGNNNFRIFGRLREGCTLEQARSEASILARHIADAYPDSKKGWGLLLEPMHEVFVGQYRPAMLTLMGAVVLLLLTACANISSLFLARIVSRQSELALRLALGASRVRLVVHVLAESVGIALVGGGLGLLLAAIGAGAIRALGPAGLPRLDQVGIDPAVLLFIGVMAVLAGLLAGVVPAFRGTRVDLTEPLKHGGRATGGRGGVALRSALVVSQIALSLVLLTLSGLFVRSFIRLQQVDPGFTPEHLLLAEVQLSALKFDTFEKQAWFLDQMQHRFRAVPGVVDVGSGSQLPFLPSGRWNYVYAGDRPQPPLEARRGADRRHVSEGFFRTLGIPIVAGRSFGPDDRAGSPEVVVINQALADLLWPGESAVGRTLVPTFRDGLRMEVVGVAASVREFGPESRDRPVFYISSAQFPTDPVQVAVRTIGEPLALASLLKSALAELDRDAAISTFHTMESRFADRIAQPRFRTLLVGVFALLALIVAATGLYGVLAYFVAERTHELGIRIAVGAGSRNLILLVLRRGMALTGLGIAVGLAGALAASRLIRGLLFETSASDPITFVAVAACLAVVALVACLVPAGRAVSVDPLVALRAE